MHIALKSADTRLEVKNSKKGKCWTAQKVYCILLPVTYINWIFIIIVRNIFFYIHLPKAIKLASIDTYILVSMHIELLKSNKYFNSELSLINSTMQLSLSSCWMISEAGSE